MKRRMSVLPFFAALFTGWVCGCTNRAARTDAGSIAQQPPPNELGAVRARSVPSALSDAKSAATVHPHGGSTQRSNEPAPVGVRSESACGGPSTRKTIAHLVWKNQAFYSAVCAEPCTESELAERLVYYDVVLREEPRVDGCHVFDQTATHAVSALFALGGDSVTELIVYDGYGLHSDPDHRSHGYKDLIGLQNEGFYDGFVHWVEERFVWDGNRYNLKRSRRLKDGELK